ncbi:response regulator [Thalassotalea sp. M1531]|uniref:Response regulator n=1 Tax=Thalassotalea algicola TaxID=2716224 RepID=A0A7Y0LDF0_9GAMM|nr:response regulator [Thalassotalea algicola]NMP32112.1 response regulator [Thalassotalea algicola]
MKPTILLVDDEQEIVRALKRLLMKNYHVHAFNEPLKALAFFKESPTHIILCDMKMPEMTGVELLKEAFQISPKSRRIVLTGYADAEMAQAAINLGHVHAYLGKPWNNDYLIQTIERLLAELKAENKRLSTIKKLKEKNQYLQNKTDEEQLLNTEMLSNSEEVQQQNERLIGSHNDLVNLSANLISSHTQDNNGHARRIAQQARVLFNRLTTKPEVSTALYLAGLFYRIALTEQEINLSKVPFNDLKPQQQHFWQKLPDLSSEILSEPPMFSASASIVANTYFVWGSKHCQVDELDGLEEKTGAIVDAAKVLSLVVFFDLYISGQIDGESHPPLQAFNNLSRLAKKLFGQSIVNEFEKMICHPSGDNLYEVPKTVSQLKVGEILAQDVFDKLEQCLLTRHTELTEMYIDSLKSLQEETKQKLIIYTHST